MCGEEGNVQVLELKKEKSTDAAFVGSSEATGYCLFGGVCLLRGEQSGLNSLNADSFSATFSILLLFLLSQPVTCKGYWKILKNSLLISK